MLKSLTRVLFYVESWGTGGIESFIMNAIQSSAGSGLKFDVFCVHDSNDAYDASIESLGGKRYTVFKSTKPGLLQRLISGSIKWAGLLRENHYDVVHINTMNGTGFLYAAIAAFMGVKIRVVHSHNSAFGSGNFVIKSLMHHVCKYLFTRCGNIRLACSEAAGKYLFGRQKFIIIPNGVDTRRFRFVPDSRIQVRSQLGLRDSDLLFGAVGRLAEAKNPLFQIDILKALRDKGIPAVLTLVGTGPMSQEIREYAKTCKMDPYLHMPGGTKKPQEFYCAYDVVVMPSLFEGFPMALVEAATSGVACVVSHSVPNFPFQISNVTYVPGETFIASEWASIIYTEYKTRNMAARSSAAERMRIHGFDSSNLSTKLREQYNSLEY